MLPVEGSGILNDMFSEIPVGWFAPPPGGVVLELDSTLSVAEACAVLLKHDFQCAPVVDASQPLTAAWTDRYLGIIDLISIVQWLVEGTSVEYPVSLDSLLSLKVEFGLTPISSLAALDRWTPFVPISPGLHTMLDVMLLLGKYGVHRVCVVDADASKISNMVTQSAVLRLLHAHLADFSGLVDLTLEELEMVREEHVVAVSASQPYWSALGLLAKNHISAVPVIDAAGTLVGNISGRDIRRLLSTPEGFARLGCPISESLDRTRPLYTCVPSDTLATVLSALMEHHVHRLYRIDADGRPVGVVSLREVIAQFVREPENSKLDHYFDEMASFSVD